MKKIIFWLGTVLFIWPLVSLLVGLVKKGMTNTLSLGLYDLVDKTFPGFAFLFFFALMIIGFCFMSYFSPEKK